MQWASLKVTTCLMYSLLFIYVICLMGARGKKSFFVRIFDLRHHRYNLLQLTNVTMTNVWRDDNITMNYQAVWRVSTCLRPLLVFDCSALPPPNLIIWCDKPQLLWWKYDTSPPISSDSFQKSILTCRQPFIRLTCFSRDNRKSLSYSYCQWVSCAQYSFPRHHSIQYRNHPITKINQIVNNRRALSASSSIVGLLPRHTTLVATSKATSKSSYITGTHWWRT